MFSLESDEMTVFWPNDSLTFTFYVIISNRTDKRGGFDGLFKSLIRLGCVKTLV